MFFRSTRACLLLAAGGALLSSALPAQAAVAYLAPGLTGRYFNGYWSGDPNFFSTNTPEFTRTDSSIDFSDKTFNHDYFSLNAWNFDGTSLSDEETFSVEWTGQLVVGATGAYNFDTYSDDGIDVFIDNTSVISNPGIHSPTTNTGSISLASGIYPIKFYYGEQNIHSVARLRWKHASASTYEVVLTQAPGSPVPGPLPQIGRAHV